MDLYVCPNREDMSKILLSSSGRVGSLALLEDSDK